MTGDTNRAGGKSEPLSEQQRRLVQENIGLVWVHLRRHVSNLSVPRRDREWEDLFQEGCLGLMRAAVTFRPESGIPFAAFALPRIHNAVSRALQTKFATVYIPPHRGDARRGDRTAALPSAEVEVHSVDSAEADQRRSQGAGAPEHGQSPWSASGGSRAGAAPQSGLAAPLCGAQRVQVRSLSDECEPRQAEATRHDPFDKHLETIGQRLRGKYERAARAAAQDVSAGVSRRGDREELVRVLLEDRFLIPHEESRTALRQVARETKSSYARVSECDKQLSAAIRQRLEADPEFLELRRRSRTSPEGAELPINDAFERALASASADEFMARLRTADPPERAALLDSLLTVSENDLDEVLRDCVAQMSSGEREGLLHQSRRMQR